MVEEVLAEPLADRHGLEPEHQQGAIVGGIRRRSDRPAAMTSAHDGLRGFRLRRAVSAARRRVSPNRSPLAVFGVHQAIGPEAEEISIPASRESKASDFRRCRGRVAARSPPGARALPRRPKSGRRGDDRRWPRSADGDRVENPVEHREGRCRPRRAGPKRLSSSADQGELRGIPGSHVNSRRRHHRRHHDRGSDAVRRDVAEHHPDQPETQPIEVVEVAADLLGGKQRTATSA